MNTTGRSPRIELEHADQLVDRAGRAGAAEDDDVVVAAVDRRWMIARASSRSAVVRRPVADASVCVLPYIGSTCVADEVLDERQRRAPRRSRRRRPCGAGRTGPSSTASSPITESRIRSIQPFSSPTIVTVIRTRCGCGSRAVVSRHDGVGLRGASAKLTLWQRMAIRKLRRKAGRKDGEPLEPEDWEVAWRLHEKGFGGMVAALLPHAAQQPALRGSAARRSPGSAAGSSRPLGYRPSRKNPTVCATCVEFSPPGGIRPAHRRPVRRPARIHRPLRRRRPARGVGAAAPLLPLRRGRAVPRRGHRQADRRRGDGALPARHQARDVARGRARA